MANPLNGEATVKLSDGRSLRFAYGFDGLIALEEASGLKMPAVYAELLRCQKEQDMPGLRLQRAIIYGGLQEHHPEISLKEAGDLIVSEAEAIGQAFEALQAAHGPKDEKEGAPADGGEDPSKSTAGTGAASSKAGAEPVTTP